MPDPVRGVTHVLPVSTEPVEGAPDDHCDRAAQRRISATREDPRRTPDHPGGGAAALRPGAAPTDIPTRLLGASMERVANWASEEARLRHDLGDATHGAEPRSCQRGEPQRGADGMHALVASARQRASAARGYWRAGGSEAGVSRVAERVDHTPWLQAVAGMISRSMRLAFSISATRRSYAACRFSHERASPPK